MNVGGYFDSFGFFCICFFFSFHRMILKLVNSEMQITPSITLIMVLLAISPSLIKAWKDPKPRMITRWVAYSYTCGFLFGWHVHEKASLHFVIPLGIIALKSVEDAKHYFFLSIGMVAPHFHLQMFMFIQLLVSEKLEIFPFFVGK